MLSNINNYAIIPIFALNRDTKNLLEILKGLFFFIYCPLLPLWWLVEFSFEWIQRKRRRERRRKEFIAKKKERQAKEENTYLMLDKYTRGTKEKKVIDFDAEKNKVKKKKQKEIEGIYLITAAAAAAASCTIN